MKCVAKKIEKCLNVIKRERIMDRRKNTIITYAFLIGVDVLIYDIDDIVLENVYKSLTNARQD
jgi:hypothetical protein